jgi:hypothetical protein
VTGDKTPSENPRLSAVKPKSTGVNRVNAGCATVARCDKRPEPAWLIPDDVRSRIFTELPPNHKNVLVAFWVLEGFAALSGLLNEMESSRA